MVPRTLSNEASVARGCRFGDERFTALVARRAPALLDDEADRSLPRLSVPRFPPEYASVDAVYWSRSTFYFSEGGVKRAVGGVAGTLHLIREGCDI